MDDRLEPLPDDLEYIDAPRPNRDPGAVGALVWLPLSELFIDRDYQRHVLAAGRKNIKAMIEGFSWALFGALVVGKRGEGRHAVIDGQHRAVAARMRGDIERVPCIVLLGGQTQEAQAFSAINNNVTRVHPLQAFRASVVAGDPSALEIVRLTGQAGIKIVPYPKTGLRDGECMCPTLILKELRRHGSAVVLAALKLLRAMDPAAGLGNVAVIGTIGMMARHPSWVDRAEELGRKVALSVAKLDNDTKQRKMSYGGLLASSFEHLLTKAIENTERASSRFYSPEAQRRAMAGR